VARRVFFSFHHERDVWRAGQVRNSWITQDRDAAGFWDSAEWEEVKKKDDATIHRWIDRQMSGTSVTVVLIGALTSTRPHVRYEIEQSVAQKKGLLGVRIHMLKDRNGRTDSWGPSPLAYNYPVYDYVAESGYKNIGDWVEAAAKAAGR
jgi:hypothetical protein